MKHPLTQPHSFLLILITLLSPQTLSQCYYPNGTQETDPAYQPCPGFDGTARMCCATNRTNPFGGADTNGWTANKCLPNGLCLDGTTTIDQHGQTVLVQQYWRDLCTSRNWNDGGCLKGCVSDANDRTTIMTPCGNPNTSTTWCCGDTTDCCNSSSAEYIAATLQGYVLPSSTASTVPGSTAVSTSRATSTTTNVSPTSASLGGGTSMGLSTGAKAGIGIGVGVGAVVLLAGLAWVLIKRRKPRAALEEGERPTYPPLQAPAELEGAEAAKEMPGNSTTSIQELPGH